MDSKTIGLLVAVGLLAVATAWQQSSISALAVEIDNLRAEAPATAPDNGARGRKGRNERERTADSRRRGRQERAEKRRQRRMLDPEQLREDLTEAAAEAGLEAGQIDAAMQSFVGHSERIDALRSQVRAGEVESGEAGELARESRETVRGELAELVGSETADSLVAAVLPGGNKGGERVRTEQPGEDEAGDEQEE